MQRVRSHCVLCALLAGVAGVMGVIAGCKSGGSGGPDSDPPGRTAPSACPFEPVVARVHPLTHVDARSPGVAADKCLLVLHLELRDQFGDAVKGVGDLKVELYKPGPGTSPGMETQSLVWEVPAFAEAETNSARFDPATRTYRLPLVADRWVAQWLSAEGGALRAGSPAWLKVRVALTAGGGRPMVDEFVVQP